MLPLKDNLPNDRFPVVTVLAIVACVLAYVLAQGGIGGSPDDEIVRHGAIPYQLTHPGERCGTEALLSGGGPAAGAPGELFCTGERAAGGETVASVGGERSGGGAWATLLTSLLLSAGLLQLVANMLFLWLFGANVEDSMARWRYVLFLLAGGIAGIALQVAVDPDGTVPVVGATGAVAAVLGGYLLLHPRARVVSVTPIPFMAGIVETPAALLIAVWFAAQAPIVAFALGDVAGAGGLAAWLAPLGGFLFGLVAIRLFAQRRKQVPPRYDAKAVSA